MDSICSFIAILFIVVVVILSIKNIIDDRSKSGKPPSAVHDPKGYDRWHEEQENNRNGSVIAIVTVIAIGVILILLVRSCS